MNQYRELFEERVEHYYKKFGTMTISRQRAFSDVVLTYCRSNDEPFNSESVDYIREVVQHG
jgi:hypothetical protein